MIVGLLILRVALGLTLAAHGAQKLWGWFGGGGLEGVGAWLESQGFSPGRRAALFAGVAEAGGGLALAFGLLTPLAAASIVGVMLVAIVTAHLSSGFFAQNGGYEYPLVLALGATSLAFTGPGAISLDALLGLELSGAVWGLGALLVGAVGGAVQLAGRQRQAPAPSQAEPQSARDSLAA